MKLCRVVVLYMWSLQQQSKDFWTINVFFVNLFITLPPWHGSFLSEHPDSQCHSKHNLNKTLMKIMQWNESYICIFHAKALSPQVIGFVAKRSELCHSLPSKYWVLPMASEWGSLLSEVKIIRFQCNLVGFLFGISQVCSQNYKAFEQKMDF